MADRRLPRADRRTPAHGGRGDARRARDGARGRARGRLPAHRHGRGDIGYGRAGRPRHDGGRLRPFERPRVRPRLLLLHGRTHRRRPGGGGTRRLLHDAHARRGGGSDGGCGRGDPHRPRDGSPRADLAHQGGQRLRVGESARRAGADPAGERGGAGRDGGPVPVRGLAIRARDHRPLEDVLEPRLRGEGDRGGRGRESAPDRRLLPRAGTERAPVGRDRAAQGDDRGRSLHVDHGERRLGAHRAHHERRGRRRVHGVGVGDDVQRRRGSQRPPARCGDLPARAGPLRAGAGHCHAGAGGAARDVDAGATAGAERPGSAARRGPGGPGDLRPRARGGPVDLRQRNPAGGGRRERVARRRGDMVRRRADRRPPRPRHPPRPPSVRFGAQPRSREMGGSLSRQPPPRARRWRRFRCRRGRSVRPPRAPSADRLRTPRRRRYGRRASRRTPPRPGRTRGRT